jgi:Tol biopolymer transport system component
MKRLLIIFTLVLLGGVVSAQDEYHIVFSSTRDGQEEIYVSDAGGENPHNLTQNRARDWHPDWSPDGMQIVFTSDRDGNQELYIMNNNGTEQRNLTNSPTNENSPAWSPDGRFVAFASDRDGAPDLYMIEIEMQEVTRLTTDGAVKGAPAWSPDSSQIVYWADDGGVTQIFVVGIDGSEPQRLTTEGPNNWPAWSRDGSQIAYENAASGAADIYVMNADGSSPINITNTPTNEIRPAWPADGSEIIFTSDRDGNLELYAMQADGSGVRRLTSIEGDDQAPAWQPVPAALQPGGAVMDLNFVQLPQSAVGSQEQQVYGDGRVKLYAPKQINLDTPFQVRLEVIFDQAVLPTATPVLDANAPTPTPMTLQVEQFATVYRVMGAELQGIDLGRFDMSPNPSDYVLRLDPNVVNFWEWTLRPKPDQAFGQNFLSVSLYLPEVQPDGTVLKSPLNNIPFQVEVLAPGAPVDKGEEEVYEPVESSDEPDFTVMFADDASFTILTQSEQNIADVTVSPAGGSDEYAVGRLFRAVTDSAWAWEPGICMRYVREGEEPVLPMACNGELLELVISAVDVFWYDSRGNRLRDIVVRYNGRAIPCSSAEQRCDIGD